MSTEKVIKPMNQSESLTVESVKAAIAIADEHYNQGSTAGARVLYIGIIETVDEELSRARAELEESRAMDASKAKEIESLAAIVFKHPSELATTKAELETLWGMFDIGSEYLGQTNDFFEGCCIRKSAELRLGYHPNHGRTA